jgi:hypothetical protein
VVGGIVVKGVVTTCARQNMLTSTRRMVASRVKLGMTRSERSSFRSKCRRSLGESYSLQGPKEIPVLLRRFKQYSAF